MVALLSVSLTGCATMMADSANTEGVKRYQSGQYDLALSSFHDAAYINPEDPDSYYNLGATYQKIAERTSSEADFTRAEQNYDYCLSLAPNHPACYRSKAVMLANRGRPEEAQRMLADWSRKSPHLAAPRIELARLSYELGNTPTAEKYLREALEKEPKNAVALAAWGKIREDAGDMSGALENYERSYMANGNQPGLRMRIASLRSSVRGGSIATTPPNGVDSPTGTRVVSEPETTTIR